MKNLISNLFVILIALMSITFLCFSVVLYASHKNWKETAQKEDDKIKPAMAKKQELVDQKDALARTIAEEKDAYQKTVAALKTKTDSLAADNTALANKNDELDSDLRERTKVIGENNTAISAYQKEIEQISSDLASAQEKRSEYLSELAKVVGELHEQATTIGDIEKRNKALQEDFDKAKSVLDMNNLTASPELYDRVPAKNITATVVAVKDGSPKLVLIDAGSDSGLKSKHLLEAYKGATYLGRVEVVTVDPHQAVCQILPQYQQGEIMEGDRVSAKFE